MAVEMWQGIKMIPVYAKMYKSRFEATAQIKPGIRKER